MRKLNEKTIYILAITVMIGLAGYVLTSFYGIIKSGETLVENPKMPKERVKKAGNIWEGR